MATVTPIATELMVATDISYTNLLKHYNGNYATQLPTTAGELTKGVQLYSKMRHEDQNAGWTPWSTDVTFQIAQYERWVAHYTSLGADRVQWRCSAIDNENYLYLGGSLVTSPYEVILIKLGTDRSIIWKRVLPSTENGKLSKIKFGPDGYLYGIGNIGGSYFVNKWDTDGNCIWQKNIAGPSSGNYTLGEFICMEFDNEYGGLYIGTHVTNATLYQTYPAIIRLNLNTFAVSCQMLQSLSIGSIRALKYDTSNHRLYIGGAASNTTAYLGYINVAYQNIWATSGVHYILDTAMVLSIDLDSVGNVYMTCGYSNSTIIKFNSMLTNIIWQKKPNFVSSYFNDIRVNNNNIYVSGWSTVDSNYNCPTFANLTTDGNLLWDRSISNDVGTQNDISSDSLGGLYVGTGNGYVLAISPIGPDIGILPNMTQLAWSASDITSTDTTYTTTANSPTVGGITTTISDMTYQTSDFSLNLSSYSLY